MRLESPEDPGSLGIPDLLSKSLGIPDLLSESLGILGIHDLLSESLGIPSFLSSMRDLFMNIQFQGLGTISEP
jgi:hypothetical protein